MKKRRNPFDVRRSGVPIENHSIKDSVRTNISFSQEFALFDAAISAGATLQELEDLIAGKYSQKLQARILVWHKYRQLIDVNTQDAIKRSMKK